jgi:virginiamycin B lyase
MANTYRTAVCLATFMVACLLPCQVAFAGDEFVTVPWSLHAEFPFAGEYMGYTSLTLGSEGDMWFTQANPGRLDRISPNGVITAEYVVPVGAASDVPGESLPQEIVQETGGNIWFTDAGVNSTGHGLIGDVTSAGQIDEFPVPSLGSPQAIAADHEGNVWFTEPASGRIGKATSAGVITEYAVPPEPNDQRSQASSPRELALGPDGNMWFTDLSESSQGQNYVGRISPSGESKKFALPVPYNRPLGIAGGADGNVWFTEPSNAIGRITPAGDIHEFAVPELSESSTGIVPGPDGNIWFTEGSNALGRITPAGVVTSFTPVLADGEAPNALAYGTGSDLWYSEGPWFVDGAEHIGRFTVPFAPASEQPPAVLGQAVEGQTLSATLGSWSHDPSAFDVQWQSCDAAGASCTDFPGRTTGAVTLGSSDVGHTLRVTVRASGLGGSASAVSSPTAVVGFAPRGRGPENPPGRQSPPPQVQGSVGWKFGRARRYLIIEGLRVRGIPQGGWVQVQCKGHGCPFAHKRVDPLRKTRKSCHSHHCPKAVPVAVSELDLKGLFGAHHLKVGTRVVVDILRAGWFGKAFSLIVRENAKPLTHTDCLALNTDVVQGQC